MTDTVMAGASSGNDLDFGYIWDGTEVSYRPSADWRTHVSDRVRFHENADDDVDPVTFEVVRNRLWSSNIAHGEQVTRVSGSPVFASLDFNMSILTEDGEIVQNAPFIQFLNAGAPFGVRYTLENMSETPGIEDGDVFLMNDPWIAATHQMDVLFLRPVFVDGRLFAWVSNAGHQYDLGGTVPGGWPQNAVDVFHDPIGFTPLKIMSRNRLSTELERMYLRNSRMPDMVALDLRAQISGCGFAADRVTELCQRFGPETVKGVMRKIIDNAQDSFRRKLERIPDGTWSEVRFMDHKLPGDRHTYRVQINLTKRGDRLAIDNQGTAPQTDVGPVGFPFAAMVGSLTGAMSTSLAFEQLFAVGGITRQLDYEIEPGLLTAVKHPAAVGASVINVICHLNAVQQCISRMLATDHELSKDALTGGSDFPVVVVAGRNDDGEPYGQAILDHLVGGSGARSWKDGVDTSGPTWSPLTFLLNVESVEQWYPLVYLYRRQRQDSGGAGRWRGGAGLEYSWIPYHADSMDVMTFTSGMANSSFSAAGLFGGYPSPAARVLVAKDTNIGDMLTSRRLPHSIEDLEAEDQYFCSGKENAVPVGPADVCEGVVNGGGGYGDPLLRDAERVAADLATGLVSDTAASDVYGVKISNGEADPEATAQRRAALRQERARWRRAPGGALGTSTAATGEPPRAVHEYLSSEDRADRRVLVCAQCGEAICDAADNYKAHLLMDAGPAEQVPGAPGVAPAHFIDESVELRRYCCPGCQVLMTTEVTLASEPVCAEFLLWFGG
jgi:N-methylhydantoinase B